MTELASQPRESRAVVKTGGEIAAMVPQTLEEGFRLASAIAASGLAPQGLRSAEQIMVAILAGAEIGLPPFQALQSFAVVNGRPTLWGDGLIAVVRSHGFKVKEWLEGEGEMMIAHCEVTRPDSGEIILGDFSVNDAKKANLWGKTGPWQQHPKRMLKMRARSFACRDGAADVLRGFQVREEVEDYTPIRNVSPERSNLAARLTGTPAATGFSLTHVATETGAPHDADFTRSDAESSSADQDGMEGERSAPIQEPAAQSESDDFPGDRAPQEAKQAATEQQPPEYLFESAGAFSGAAKGYLDALSDPDDLKALWTQWQPDLRRLRTTDPAAAAHLVAHKKQAEAKLGSVQ